MMNLLNMRIAECYYKENNFSSAIKYFSGPTSSVPKTIIKFYFSNINFILTKLIIESTKLIDFILDNYIGIQLIMETGNNGLLPKTFISSLMILILPFISADFKVLNRFLV